MLDLKVDSKTKTIKMSALLTGEKEAIDISIGCYSITDESGVIKFKAEKVSVSREWLSVLASELICGKEFIISSGIAGKVAKLLL